MSASARCLLLIRCRVDYAYRVAIDKKTTTRGDDAGGCVDPACDLDLVGDAAAHAHFGFHHARVSTDAQDIIETVAQQHKFAAIFSREAVIIGAKNLDITDEVIKLMNSGGKKVAVDWSAKPKKPGLVIDGQ